MANKEEIEQENRNIALARTLTDLALITIQTDSSVDVVRAYGIVEHLKEKILRIFPDKGHVFELVIRPRLERAIKIRFRL